MEPFVVDAFVFSPSSSRHLKQLVAHVANVWRHRNSLLRVAALPGTEVPGFEVFQDHTDNFQLLCSG